MAGKPIEISFIGDVAQYLRATKKLEVSTEDIADALVEVSNSSEDLERKLSRAMRDAEKDVGTLERALKDIPKATGKAADEGKRDFERLADGMGEVGEEGASEFKQNLAQGLSSGDLDSLVQDTLGGVIAGLSGAAAGVATVVAGAAALVFKEMQEQAAKVEELTANGVAAIEAQFDLLDRKWTQAKANAIVEQFLQDNKALLAEIEPLVSNVGIDFADWVVQLSGATGQSEQARKILEDIVEEEKARARELGLSAGEWTKTAQDAQQVLDLVGNLVDEQGNVRSEQGLINTVYDRYLDKTRQASVYQQQMREDAQAMLKAVQDMPERRRTYLEFVATGSGAAYLDPGSASYSPGHVAIYNNHMRP
jgi:hypothetical protein